MSLLRDQIRRLQSTRLRVVSLSGSQGGEAWAAVIYGSVAREVDLVFATPEVLTGRLRTDLPSLDFPHCVIDEAHCIAEWGDRCRPAYVGMGSVLRKARVPVDQKTAFTATGSPHVVRRIREVLFGDRAVPVLATDPDRPNLRYAVQPVASRLRATRGRGSEPSTAAPGVRGESRRSRGLRPPSARRSQPKRSAAASRSGS